MLVVTMRRSVLFTLLVIALAACGGGDDDSIKAASLYAGHCASPRSGIDPETGVAYADVQGSATEEKLWIRSWIDDTYLWYSEVPQVDMTMYDTPVDYFKVMKTDVQVRPGTPKDRFHFTYDTSVWVALSQSGVEAGYGVQWALLAASPPRRLLVADVEPGSPAALAGLKRGAEVTWIDGVEFTSGRDVNTLNDGMYPGPNETHTFVIDDPGPTIPRMVTLLSADIASDPVKYVTTIPSDSGPVGYLLFNDHIATAEKALYDAITELAAAQVKDLVIDMRYNGGGYLTIAAQFAYMIAPPDTTRGKTFEREVFNDKHPTIDPVTGQTITPTPFVGQTVGFSMTAGQPLPSLGLSRVFILSGPGTCSASEAVMNGLAGVGVEVIQIGGTTCGKPYGFYPAENCGTTYFAIQFEGANDMGFGDYADGFVPGGRLHGCVVDDDFAHLLGDPAEARLAAALNYRTTQSCPAAAEAPLLREASPQGAVDGAVQKPPWRQNRIITPRGWPGGRP